MARTSRHGSRSPWGDVAAANDNEVETDEDEEIPYVPPRLDGLHFTVTWSIRCPAQCMIGNCKTKLKTENKYSVMNNLFQTSAFNPQSRGVGQDKLLWAVPYRNR